MLAWEVVRALGKDYLPQAAFFLCAPQVFMATSTARCGFL